MMMLSFFNALGVYVCPLLYIGSKLNYFKLSIFLLYFNKVYCCATKQLPDKVNCIYGKSLFFSDYA